MLKDHRIIGVCFIMIALLAPTARAETVVVDPGEVGEGAENFFFSADSGLLIDILWSDNKTLEWGAGTHVFSVVGSPGSLGYFGILLDADGNEIPGTEFFGETPSLAGDDLHFLGFIAPPEMTVFSGIRFLSGYTLNVELEWTWNKNDRPVVGESQGGVDQCENDLDNGVVCLRDDRFEITGTWTDFANPANTQPLIWTPVEDINATAGFQNNPSGIQVVMRIADSCETTNEWWIWLGGFTDAGWDITVRDTVTNIEQNYTRDRQGGVFPTTERDTTSFSCN